MCNGKITLAAALSLCFALIASPNFQASDTKDRPRQEDSRSASAESERDDKKAKPDELELYKQLNQKTLKRLMRAVHRDPDSPLVVFNQFIKKEIDKPDWKVLDAKASLVEIMAITLQHPESNGKRYLEVATKLRAATKSENLEEFKTSVKKLNQSCAACHGWSPPR